MLRAIFLVIKGAHKEIDTFISSSTEEHKEKSIYIGLMSSTPQVYNFYESIACGKTSL